MTQSGIEPATFRLVAPCKKEYLKAKFDELETNGKPKNVGDLCRGNSDFSWVTSLDLI